MPPLSRPARAFLVAFFLAYNAFALARVHPVNWTLEENRDHLHGNVDRHVVRVFEMAEKNARLPFAQVRSHGLYLDRNPAMFLLVSELFVRAGGGRSPLPNQLFCILLWNIGLWFCFLWVRELFENELLAGIALGFLLTTPMLLHYSSSIHHEPYSFCFLHLTFYCFVRYLKRDRTPRWLWLFGICYFLGCQNYWMYYLGPFLMLQAFQLKQGEFSWKLTAITALPPIASFIFVFLEVVYARGGLAAGWFRMADVLAARTGDWRIEGSEWFPERRFLDQERLQRYPRLLARRIADNMGYPFSMFVAMLGGSLALAGREAWSRYRWLLLAIPAALSWNLLMVQHTVIHRFTGAPGYYVWMLVVAVFFVELQGVFQPRRARIAFLVLAIPLAFWALDRSYLPYLNRYARNIAAGEVVSPQREAARARSAGGAAGRKARKRGGK